MEKKNAGVFFRQLRRRKVHYPWSGQIELTYRCGLDCVHCYCKGSENIDRELTTEEWKRIFDEIQKEGCLYLTLTGGDPLVREDFLELYSYAKKKGFLITLFTNGYSLSEQILFYLEKSPPVSIEITLNGITKSTYESITGVKDSFEKTIHIIKEIHRRGIKLILKSNCLKQNKYEIGKIKAWTEDILGRPSQRRYRFKYDPMIYPRLNGDKTPTNYRLSFKELLEVKAQDKDLWEEYQRQLKAELPDDTRDDSFLYRCNAWLSKFFIDPYGRLKFCIFSHRFSVDLKTTSFHHGFYNVFPQLLNERFKTNSKCINCKLRALCYNCPARAYIETGDEESPVEYYCELARMAAGEREKCRK